jgi:beta-glucosidase
VWFKLTKNDFGFYDGAGRLRVEPGRIDVYAGDSSEATDEASFTVTG